MSTDGQPAIAGLRRIHASAISDLTLENPAATAAAAAAAAAARQPPAPVPASYIAQTARIASAANPGKPGAVHTPAPAVAPAARPAPVPAPRPKARAVPAFFAESEGVADPALAEDFDFAGNLVGRAVFCGAAAAVSSLTAAFVGDCTQARFDKARDFAAFRDEEGDQTAARLVTHNLRQPEPKYRFDEMVLTTTKAQLPDGACIVHVGG